MKEQLLHALIVFGKGYSVVAAFLLLVLIVQLLTTKMRSLEKVNGLLRFILLSLPLWAVHTILLIPLYLLGWVMIPLAAACGAYYLDDPNNNKPKDGPIYHFTWKIMYLWDNFEDGIANKNYWVAPNMFLQIVYWSAIRNPTNNLRTTPFFSVMIKASKVRFIGSFGSSSHYRPIIKKRQPPGKLLWYDQKIPHWFYAWQGLYSNFYWQFVMPFHFKIPWTSLGYTRGDLMRIWVGHKIYPTDIMGKPLGYRERGAGLANQLKVVVGGYKK